MNKHYLLWAAYNFMQPMTNDEIVTYNRLLSNSGNLAFHTSIVRALMTEGTSFTSVYFKFESQITEDFLAKANETYDAFILPLADAFRGDYLPRIRALTKLVRGLKIPCIVTSVGCSFAKRGDYAVKNAWDGEVAAFVSAVLDKSQVIGLRGEDSLAYLKRLGFTAEKDVRVIGCPSMFYYGSYLPEIRKTELSRDSLCMINTKLSNTKSVHDFMNRSCKALPNYIYIAQRIDELRFMYYGVYRYMKKDSSLPDYYPLFRSRPVSDLHPTVAYTDFPAWIEDMRKAAFSYGSNIHGAVPAILSGTPAIVIEKDRRVAEIANYFAMPSITAEETAKYRDITEVYEKADFTELAAGHAKRFDRYLSLLHENGLETVFDETSQVLPGQAPWDRLHDSQTRSTVLTFKGKIIAGSRLKSIPTYVQLVKRNIEKKTHR